MLKVVSYTSGDTYARHLIITLGRFKADLSIVALDDEGCDQRLARAIVSWGDSNRLIQAGIDREHLMLINGTFRTLGWRPTATTYGWSWAGREGVPL